MAKDTEKKLADELKQLCYANGKEKYSKDSAKVLHKLGLLYRRKSPDKQSLLQSVALMTSAFVRKPDNVEEIKQSLDEVCAHVLLLAGNKSSSQPVDDIVSDLKKQLQSFRNHADEKLSATETISYETESGNNDVRELESRRIKEIIDLQTIITDRYSNFMRCISDHCVDIMGEPACKFALVGLGSLARKEVTPYSDFESIIVLEEGVQQSDNYNEVLEYFRWFSTIFQMILIRLGETVLRFMAIPCLNDPLDPENDWFYDAYTPCGIRPDGFAPAACKNPLGRQTPTPRKPWITELIKPVSEMVKYLDSKVDMKNGYHLADILMKTCFVSRSKEVFASFENLIFEKRKFQLLHERKETLQRISKQLSENFDWYDKLEDNLGYKESLDIKRFLYRSSTLFVSALGSLYGLQECSCQEIVKKLYTMQIISAGDCHNLMLCVAVSCELRLRFYCHSRGQNDFVLRRSYFKQNCKDFDDVHLCIGTRAVVSCITYAMLLRKHLRNVKGDIPETFGLGPEPFLIREHLRIKFNIYDASIVKWPVVTKRKEYFKCCEKLCEKRPFVTIIECLTCAGLNKEAVRRIKSFLSKNQKTESLFDVFLLYRLLGQNLMVCGKFKAALKCYRKINFWIWSKKIKPNNFELKMLHLRTGKCFFLLGRSAKARRCFNIGLKDVNQIKDILKTALNYDLLLNKSYCLKSLGHRAEADEILKQLIESRQMATDEDAYDLKMNLCLYEYADDISEVGDPQKALDMCESAWKKEGDKAFYKFRYLYVKSYCLYRLLRHKEAYSCFEDGIPDLPDLDKLDFTGNQQRVCVFFQRFAACCRELGRHKKAVEFAKRALYLLQRQKFKDGSDTEKEQDLRYLIMDYTWGFILKEEQNDTSSTNDEETTENQINNDFQSFFLPGYRAFANKEYVMAVNHFQRALAALPSPPATFTPKRRRKIEKTVLQRNSCQFVTDYHRISLSTALQKLERNREAFAQCRQAWCEALMLGRMQCGKHRKIVTIKQLLLVSVSTERPAEQFRAAEFAVAFAQELGVDVFQSLVIDVYRIYLEYCLKYLTESKLAAYAYTPSLYYHAMRDIPAFKDNPDVCYMCWPNIAATYFLYTFCCDS